MGKQRDFKRKWHYLTTTQGRLFHYYAEREMLKWEATHGMDGEIYGRLNRIWKTFDVDSVSAPKVKYFFLRDKEDALLALRIAEAAVDEVKEEAVAEGVKLATLPPEQKPFAFRYKELSQEYAALVEITCRLSNQAETEGADAMADEFRE